ncbi:MAG: hypothetical protein RIC57_09180 [Balneola sp.]
MIREKQIKELDSKFEDLLKGAISAVEETEFSPEKAAERRKRAEADEFEFCRIYFPKIFTSEFNDVHKHIRSLKEGNYSVSGARLFGKSAYTFIAKPIRHIAMGKGGIVNVSLRTKTMAQERTKALSRNIKKNKLLCYDYGIEVLQDAAGYHIFQANGGQTTLIATSVEIGLRGYVDDDFKRFKLSINDDLYDRASVKSDLDNAKVVDFVTSESWGQMEPDGLNITLGNSITEKAPIVKIKEDHTGESHFSLPALNAEGESNWPERYSTEFLKEKRDGNPEKKIKPMAYDIWMGDYMDEPIEKGDIMDPNWLREGPYLNMINIVASITAIDPSHGKSPSACDKGMVTGGIDDRDNVHVLDIYLRKEGYELVFDYMAELVKSMPNHKVILFENDFSQWNFADPYYKQWRERTQKVLPIIQYNSKDLKTEHRGSDKDSRMLNLVHPHQTGQILYSNGVMGTEDYKRFKNSNYVRFGKHKKTKLDGLDAMATMYIKIWEYKVTGGFQSLKQRKVPAPQLRGWFRG